MDQLWWDSNQTHHHRNEWQELATHLRKVAATLKEFIISLSIYFLEDYKPEEGDPIWVHGVWDRRGWIKDLKFLTKLERLEIPWTVILGFKPDFPNKKLRDVLPVNLQELCLRDDLSYMPTTMPYAYQWSHMGRKPTDPAPQVPGGYGVVIDQLEDYLLSGQGTSLRRLVMKHRSGNWQRHSEVTARLCQILSEAGVEGRVQIRLKANEIEDLLIYSPLPNARSVVHFNERPKTLDVDYF